MLINSLLIILRDALPTFLLIVYLLRMGAISTFTIVSSVAGSAGFLFTMLYFNEYLTQLWSGNGVDIVKALFLICLVPVSIVVTRGATSLRADQISQEKLNQWAVCAAIIFLTVPGALNFSIFVFGHMISDTLNAGVMTGVILGLGISASVAILLNLLLAHVVDNKKNGQLIVLFLFCLFNAGQVAGAASILEQINWLENSERLWDSSSILREQNEYGQLIGVLIGYEATPSLNYLLFYTIAFLAAFYGFIKKTHSVMDEHNENQ